MGPYLYVVEPAASFLIEGKLCQFRACVSNYLRTITTLIPSRFRDNRFRSTKEDHSRDRGLEPIIPVDRASRLVAPLLGDPIRKGDKRLLRAFACQLRL